MNTQNSLRPASRDSNQPTVAPDISHDSASANWRAILDHYGDPIVSLDPFGLWECEVTAGIPAAHTQILLARVRGLTQKQAQANARLIAAAPEMLAALESCATYLMDDDAIPGCLVQARAALARAQGGAL